jgi:hypothetical protein
LRVARGKRLRVARATTAARQFRTGDQRAFTGISGSLSIHRRSRESV